MSFQEIKQLAERFEKIANKKRCNCEQKVCEDKDKHKPGDCKNEAGDKKALYIGAICDTCAKTLPTKYLKDD